MEEEESRGPRQARWEGGTEMCPVGDHAGKRSKYFVSKVASRKRPSEGRQRP